MLTEVTCSKKIDERGAWYYRKTTVTIEEFKTTNLTDSDGDSIKEIFNERTLQVSSEFASLPEARIKEVIIELFAIVSIEYTIKKIRRPKMLRWPNTKILAIGRDVSALFGSRWAPSL